MTAPCTGPRPAVLEADVEDAVVEWAENHDWLVRKMRFIGRRGCPDRYFYGYGHIVMIEFKRPNGTRSAGQVREHRRMENAGLKVHVIEYAEDGISILKNAMREPRPHEPLPRPRDARDGPGPRGVLRRHGFRGGTDPR